MTLEEAIKHAVREEPLDAGDTIYRQAAIDAILGVLGLRNPNWFPNQTEREVFKAIKYLPSAQPEIIRCKDCKHLQKWRSEESAKKFGQIYECARNVFDCPKPEDFCSRAERETDD